MLITFNKSGSLANIDFQYDSFSQGDNNIHIINVIIDDESFNNLDYNGYVQFLREGETTPSPKLIMTHTEKGYTFKMNTEWYTAIAGTLKMTIEIKQYDEDGLQSNKAFGIINIPVMESVSGESGVETTITNEEYIALINALNEKANLKVENTFTAKTTFNNGVHFNSVVNFSNMEDSDYVEGQRVAVVYTFDEERNDEEFKIEIPAKDGVVAFTSDIPDKLVSDKNLGFGFNGVGQPTLQLNENRVLGIAKPGDNFDSPLSIKFPTAQVDGVTTLVAEENLKTINGESLIGSGNIKIENKGIEIDTTQKTIDVGDWNSKLGFKSNTARPKVSYRESINGTSYFRTNELALMSDVNKKADEDKVYTKNEINDIVSNISTLNIQVVTTLPTTNISTTTIYLKKINDTEQNLYEEYIYVNNKWELIGTTEVDLSDYELKSNLKALAYKDSLNKNDVGLGLLRNVEIYSKTEIDENFKSKYDKTSSITLDKGDTNNEIAIHVRRPNKESGEDGVLADVFSYQEEFGSIVESMEFGDFNSRLTLKSKTKPKWSNGQHPVELATMDDLEGLGGGSYPTNPEFDLAYIDNLHVGDNIWINDEDGFTMGGVQLYGRYIDGTGGHLRIEGATANSFLTEIDNTKVSTPRIVFNDTAGSLISHEIDESTKKILEFEDGETYLFGDTSFNTVINSATKPRWCNDNGDYKELATLDEDNVLELKYEDDDDYRTLISPSNIINEFYNNSEVSMNAEEGIFSIYFKSSGEYTNYGYGKISYKYDNRDYDISLPQKSGTLATLNDIKYIAGDSINFGDYGYGINFVGGSSVTENTDDTLVFGSTSKPIWKNSETGETKQLATMDDIGLPINIATASQMDAVLVSENIGKVYLYTGVSNENYTNGKLYIIMEE